MSCYKLFNLEVDSNEYLALAEFVKKAGFEINDVKELGFDEDSNGVGVIIDGGHITRLKATGFDFDLSDLITCFIALKKVDHLYLNDDVNKLLATV